MNCPKCLQILHYHSGGMTCRACGFSKSHYETLMCTICKYTLEEAEKTTGVCVFCSYKMSRQWRLGNGKIKDNVSPIPI
jgi:hypothetical protein